MSSSVAQGVASAVSNASKSGGGASYGGSSSSSSSKAIADYGNDYNAAKARGDTAGMEAAHQGAEAIRASQGYSGGVDGSQYIPLSGGSSSGGSSSSGGGGSSSSKYTFTSIEDAQSKWPTLDAAGKDAAHQYVVKAKEGSGETYDPKTGVWSKPQVVPAAPAPAAKYTETKYKDSSGASRVGYIIGGKTFTDVAGTKEVDVGSVVSAGGTEYLKTEGGGVDLNKSKPVTLYDKDPEYGLPNQAQGNVYAGPNGGYYDAKTGRAVGAGIINLGDGTYYDVDSGRTISQQEANQYYEQVIAAKEKQKYEQQLTEQRAMIEQQMNAMMEAQIAANQAAVNQGTQQLTDASRQGQQALDQAAADSTITAHQNMDNLALRSAKLGDLGGIGQKQYGEAANANDKRLLEIELEKKNLETTTAQQIAALQAEGKMADAEVISNLGMKQLQMLIEEEDKLRAWQRDQELTSAELLGTYRGQPTVQTQTTNYNRALKRLELGMFNQEDAQILGLDSNQAKQFADYINLLAQIDLASAKAKLAEFSQTSPAAGSSSGGSSSSSGSSGGASYPTSSSKTSEQRAATNEMIQRWYQANTAEGFKQTVAAHLQKGDITEEDYRIWQSS